MEKEKRFRINKDFDIVVKGDFGEIDEAEKLYSTYDVVSKKGCCIEICKHPKTNTRRQPSMGVSIGRFPKLVRIASYYKKDGTKIKAHLRRKWLAALGDLKMKCENCLNKIIKGIVRDDYAFCSRKCYNEWIEENRREYLGSQYSGVAIRWFENDRG